jgi:hypothetical protein
MVYYVYTLNDIFLRTTLRHTPQGWKGTSMKRTTTMVRTYLNQQAFAADEQQLGLEGWSVESTVNPHPKQGLLDRIRSRFTRKATHLVVPYHRPASF